MNRLDCRNMECPAPVISVKKALETGADISVLLDDGAPRENVVRFAKNRGFLVTEEQNGDGWTISIKSSENRNREVTALPAGTGRVILITSDRLGEGPEELGRLLMKNFIHTLVEVSNLPEKIFFMNSAVLLACEGSELIEALQKLVNTGVEVYSCGLCLDFFGQKEKLRAGSTTNMLTSAETLLSAGQVIKL
jgi:selenium metabolism protein YedF